MKYLTVLSRAGPSKLCRWPSHTNTGPLRPTKGPPRATQGPLADGVFVGLIEGPHILIKGPCRPTEFLFERDKLLSDQHKAWSDQKRIFLERHKTFFQLRLVVHLDLQTELSVNSMDKGLLRAARGPLRPTECSLLGQRGSGKLKEEKNSTRATHEHFGSS